MFNVDVQTLSMWHLNFRTDEFSLKSKAKKVTFEHPSQLQMLGPDDLWMSCRGTPELEGCKAEQWNPEQI